jgi:UDP-GlcNAc:undecaprenyl-phosphate GlcNAc-1-phosphate transferase
MLDDRFCEPADEEENSGSRNMDSEAQISREAVVRVTNSNLFRRWLFVGVFFLCLPFARMQRFHSYELLGIIGTFAGVSMILPSLSRVAAKTGLLDYPNSRKIKSDPVPLVGGIAIVSATLLICPLFLRSSPLNGFYTGLILLTLVGLWDDFGPVSVRWNFAVQVLAVAAAVYSGEAVLHSLGDLTGTGPTELGQLAVPVTVFCMVGLINAYNMIDGLDGLAGGVSLIAFLSFAFLSYLSGQSELMFLSLSLGGAVAGFLIFNWHPARLFMGNAGSLPLGFSLAYLSVAITQRHGSPIQPTVPLLILAVPLVDTVIVIFRRLAKRKNPFAADKNHLHHIMIKMGLGEKSVVVLILSVTFVLSVLAISGAVAGLPDYYLFAVFIVYCTGHLMLPVFAKQFSLKGIQKGRRVLPEPNSSGLPQRALSPQHSQRSGSD